MFKALIEGDLLTGKVTNHRVQLPINRARQTLRDKAESEVRRLWKKIDTVLAKWVAVNRRTRPEQAVGLEDIDTPKGCLRRLPGLDDADLFKVLLFDEYPPLQRLMHGDKDNVPQVLATLALHEAACGRIDGVLKAANLLEIACRNRVERQKQGALEPCVHQSDRVGLDGVASDQGQGSFAWGAPARSLRGGLGTHRNAWRCQPRRACLHRREAAHRVAPR